MIASGASFIMNGANPSPRPCLPIPWRFLTRAEGKDQPPYTVVGGNPARVIRKRFADEEIEKLLPIRWWDWEPERITAHRDLLTSQDVEAF